MTSTGVSQTSREAVEAARSGSETAWRELFDEHYPKLYRYFLARVDAAYAEDLAAETFSDAYRGLDKFRWRNRPFGAWLYGIARNRLRMHYRKRRETDELSENIEHVRNEYLEVEIRDVLGRLSAEHRAAIELRYVLGLSGVEAAAALGRSHGAFRVLLHRATAAFKNEYGREAGGKQ
jgi:RNA polymerase sigma-70 factor (ECF subfamily)